MSIELFAHNQTAYEAVAAMLAGIGKAAAVWLAKWLNEQRQINIGNRPGKSLTAEQVRRLEAIGMTWGKRRIAGRVEERVAV